MSTVRQITATRFERFITEEGRTCPLVLSSRSAPTGQSESFVVKAIGCPEISSEFQIVCEIAGNAVARRLGVSTPEPCIVEIPGVLADQINNAALELGLTHRVHSGPASGCRLLQPSPQPLIAKQNLTPHQSVQAARLYVSDVLTQNPDRRQAKMNCAIWNRGIVAFDFEMSFQHVFLPIIGGTQCPPWAPCRCFPCRSHLFYDVAQQFYEEAYSACEQVRSITRHWWNQAMSNVISAWPTLANKIWDDHLISVGARAEEFKRDVENSLVSER